MQMDYTIVIPPSESQAPVQQGSQARLANMG
jgi:hypothetical protein